MSVERAHVEQLAENRHAAIVRAAACDDGLVGVTIGPEHASGRRIQCDDIVRPLRQIHDPVDHERVGCQLPVTAA